MISFPSSFNAKTIVNGYSQSLILFVLTAQFAAGQIFSDEQPANSSKPKPTAKSAVSEEPKPTIDKSTPSAMENAIALNPQRTVFLDRAAKKVVLKSEVVLKEGFLELLVCIKGTKHHESILAVNTDAKTVHAALVALGLQPGTPARYNPFVPPRGPNLSIQLTWTDSDGNTQRVPAEHWIRSATRRYFVKTLKEWPTDLKLFEADEMRWDSKHKELLWFGHMTAEQRKTYRGRSQSDEYHAALDYFFETTQFRPIKAPWVFVGSAFRKNPETGEEQYLGEVGDLICVSNFLTAVIDVGIESSDSNDGLSFEAWTERLPPIGTSVDVEISEAPAPANPS